MPPPLNSSLEAKSKTMVVRILILNICSVLASIPFTSPPIDDDND